MELSLWRAAVRGGESTFVWDNAGALPLEAERWALAGPKGTRVSPVLTNLAERRQAAWDLAYSRKVTVPPDTRPGTYTLLLDGSLTSVRVTVMEARKPAQTQVLAPGLDDAQRISSALAKGDVVLSPGLYTLDRPVRLASGRRLVGYGATLWRTWGEAPASYVFTPADGAGVEGIDFFRDAQRPWGQPDWAFVALVAPGYGGNMSVRHCRFRGVQLGEWNRPGFLAESCVWDRCGAEQVTGPSLFLRCRFVGLNDPAYRSAWSTWGGRDVALVDSDFEDTDRGPVCQTNRAAVDRLFVSGVQVRGCRHMPNGCEGFAFEGPHPVVRGTFLHLHYEGEGPAFQAWDCGFATNTLRDFTFDGGQGLVFASHNGAAQTGNTVMQGEVRGGYVHLGPNAGGNLLDGVAATNPRPTRANQFGGQVDLGPRAVISSAAPGNRMRGCVVVGAPAGWTDFHGLEDLEAETNRRPVA